MPSEAAAAADFTIIRYAQVLEDADILLEALDIQPEDECLSIASAGDNARAMLARGPRKVIGFSFTSSSPAPSWKRWGATPASFATWRAV